MESSKNGTTNSGSKLDKGFVGHKAAKMMKRAKNLELRQQKAIEEKVKAVEKCGNNRVIKIRTIRMSIK